MRDHLQQTADALFGGGRQRAQASPQPTAVNPLAPVSPRRGWWHAEKFPGGLGPVNILTLDYWTLRARSSELFRTNLYARGLIRRLVTNVINTGLHLESTPLERLLGFEEEALSDWAETIESRFEIWAKSAKLCDYKGAQNFGQLQATIFRESFIAGDVLVVLHQDPVTKLPLVEIVNGSLIRTPLERLMQAPGQNQVTEGVELDANGRHVAYWIQQSDGLKSKRVRAYDAHGRRVAWLVYASDKRHEDVRGEPILSLVLQSLREIDRYRDSVQRKALLNAHLALFVSRDPQAAARSWGSTGGISKTTDTVLDSGGTERTFNVLETMPGAVIDSLAPGEEVKGFPANGTDEKFGDFEEAIIQAVAWAYEIPPEILRLAFSHNYSASQAANNEFNLYLYLARHNAAVSLCDPIYQEWLLSEALLQRIENSQRILDAWANPRLYDAWGAWTTTDWAGQIKPAADILKVVNAHATMCENGFELRSRAARELSGMKYSRFMKKQRRESEMLAWANEPLKALEKSSSSAAPRGAEDKEEDDDDERAA
jgi:lambda family phage portal protein